MDELDRRLTKAVKQFWTTRTRQTANQRRSGQRDTGARSAVTGGRQMDGLVSLVRDALIEGGCPEASICVGGHIELPGWFRAEKKWDLVVVHDRELVAAVEFKSQIGPSFGNNFNNRTEEALGSATDIWAAYREGAFKPSRRPWLGYLMLLEDCAASRRAVSVSQPHFNVFPEFDGASYGRRYEVLVQKLLRDRLYDGACLLTSDASNGRAGKYNEPDAELTFDRFMRGLSAHVTAACGPDLLTG